MDHADQHSAMGVGGPRRPDMPITDPTVTATADRFAELALELHDSDGVEETVDEVVQFALQP